MVTLQPLRRAAVRVVKPYVPAGAWARLRQLAPARKRRRPPVSAPPPAAEPPLVARSLPELAEHFGTDKWGLHRYASHYQEHLRRLKYETFTLLEIGIGGYRVEDLGGASLRMWKHFFPRATIFGLDIYDKSFVNEERITAFQGSQVDEDVVRSIVARAPTEVKVVIDDGSHRPEHIRATFAFLFPLLADGGFYAIEDTHTSYWPRWGGSLDLADPETTMGLVKDLVDGLNHSEFGDVGPRSYADAHVVAVHCYHNLVIIEKGTNDEQGSRPANYLIIG